MAPPKLNRVPEPSPRPPAISCLSAFSRLFPLSSSPSRVPGPSSRPSSGPLPPTSLLFPAARAFSPPAARLELSLEPSAEIPRNRAPAYAASELPLRLSRPPALHLSRAPILLRFIPDQQAPAVHWSAGSDPPPRLRPFFSSAHAFAARTAILTPSPPSRIASISPASLNSHLPPPLSSLLPDHPLLLPTLPALFPLLPSTPACPLPFSPVAHPAFSPVLSKSAFSPNPTLLPQSAFPIRPFSENRLRPRTRWHCATSPTQKKARSGSAAPCRFLFQAIASIP